MSLALVILRKVLDRVIEKKAYDDFVRLKHRIKTSLLFYGALGVWVFATVIPYGMVSVVSASLFTAWMIEDACAPPEAMR